MPVLILYKEKTIPIKTADDISLRLAKITDKLLEAKIEVRTIEPVSSYNANPIHIEMQFRDFGDWDTELLEKYDTIAMAGIGEVLNDHKIKCKYSFYILPSTPPRSIWAQESTEEGNT